MPKNISEASAIRTAIHAIEEPDNPAHIIMQFVSEYCLPAKIIAGAAGVSVQSLYSWVEEGTDVRPTDRVAERLNIIIGKLKAAEHSKFLPFAGTMKERNAQLLELLAVEPEAD